MGELRVRFQEPVSALGRGIFIGIIFSVIVSQSISPILSGYECCSARFGDNTAVLPCLFKWLAITISAPLYADVVNCDVSLTVLWVM